MAEVDYFESDVDMRRSTVEEWLEVQLSQATGARLRALSVARCGSVFRITGRAPSYYVRQVAEQTALSLIPRDRVIFQIDVDYPA
jgi:hypothetical protein